MLIASSITVEQSFHIALTRLRKTFQHGGILFKKLGEVGEHINRRGTEMMFNAFDVLLLRFRAQSEEGKKSRQSLVPVLNASRHVAAFVRQRQSTIFFV